MFKLMGKKIITILRFRPEAQLKVSFKKISKSGCRLGLSGRMSVWLYLYSLGIVKRNVGGKIVLPQVRLELTASAYHSTVYKYGALTDCATGARHTCTTYEFCFQQRILRTPWRLFLGSVVIEQGTGFLNTEYFFFFFFVFFFFLLGGGGGGCSVPS